MKKNTSKILRLAKKIVKKVLAYAVVRFIVDLISEAVVYTQKIKKNDFAHL